MDKNDFNKEQISEIFTLHNKRIDDKDIKRLIQPNVKPTNTKSNDKKNNN